MLNKISLGKSELLVQNFLLLKFQNKIKTKKNAAMTWTVVNKL